MTVSEFLSSSTRTLQHTGIENPELEAQILLSSVLGIERNKLFLAMNTELTETELAQAKKFLELRTAHLPLEYITGNVEFLGLSFSVLPGVFIPRPETELLAIEAAGRLEDLPAPLVLEIGTGSGVIAVSLALKNETAVVHANDISRAAMEVAKANATAHGVAERILFHVGSLFSAIRAERLDGTVEVLVSNPPYIPSSEIASLALEISQHEPAVAIDGGGDGLRYVRAILQEGPVFLKEGGWLLLEIGINQAEAAREMAVSAGLQEVNTVKDLPGIDRVLVARKPR